MLTYIYFIISSLCHPTLSLEKFPLLLMGGQAEGLACADPVESSPIA